MTRCFSLLTLSRKSWAVANCWPGPTSTSRTEHLLSVCVEVEGCFDVKARSEEEIRDLIEEGFPVDCQNMAQIEMVDGPMIRILSIEEAGLKKCCRLNFELFGRAAQPPCHLSDDAAQPPWRRVAADKRHPQCRGCGNTGGGACRAAFGAYATAPGGMARCGPTLTPGIHLPRGSPQWRNAPGCRPSGRTSGVFCPLLYIWCFPPTL